ncbi:Qat anti-phage system TatD family nuclease QatD [Corallococcus exercitus]|uniref:Qat anti-phage system TatD family nuclease QatD n=1 Tax=Corallococcus exercitus TaxID=2316736 RepID=UPI0035D4863D
MIDFHCHIDLYPNPKEIVEGIAQRGMYVLAVTTTPRTWQRTRQIVSNADRIKVALGLHPELVAERHSEVDLLCSLLPEARYVGEIGLDGSPQHRPSLGLQKQVLNKILSACNTLGGRILSMHSRCAVTEVLDSLETHSATNVPVLHWFSGTTREAASAAELGCWFSVGPAMARSNKGRKLIESIDQARIVTETDGPFVRNGDSPLMPWHALNAEMVLSEVWGLSAEETSRLLQNNFRRLIASLPTALVTQ